VRDVPQFVVERAATKEPVFTADEVEAWPDGLFDQLVADEVLKPTSNAGAVPCDACGEDHVEEVQFIESPPGAELRAYISCPGNGRVRVPLHRLRRWTIAPALRGLMHPGEQSTAGGVAESQPANSSELLIDELTFSVSWRGRESIELGNKKEFRLLEELAKSPGNYIAFADLAERLGGDAMDDITHIKSRLVKLLKNND